MFQSAYRIGHSTETGLTRIHNDILLAIDDNSCIILMLLDLSAALDAVDHDILLRLEHRFGITGKALSWLTSYLTDRTQFVKVANEHSTSRKLLCNVPQGLVIGPIVYSMYTAPLADIMRQHGLNFHFYADDTQLYLSFNPEATGEPMHSLSRVQSCISDITNWMTSNKLMLNSDKTEALAIVLVLHWSLLQLAVT